VPVSLDHGIDYNCSYWDGSTLLHGAAEHGNVNLVEKLLSLGHPADPENEMGFTPLHIASSIDVKRVLLTAGANVNAFDEDGLTPLHTAAQQGAREEMELLLSFGASVSALTKKGLTVLDVALLYEKSSDSTVLQTTKFLLDHGLGANDRNETGCSTLHYACIGLRVDAAMLLIKKGADVNSKDSVGGTPLRGVLNGHVSKATVDVLSLLVDHGADLNSKDYEGFTALHRIGLDSDKCYYEGFRYRNISADMAELLLDYGVDIEARDDEGKTVLYWFFKRGQLAAAELFIKRGADVKASSDSGETMLHAISGNASSLCPALLERGVRVNALTIEGWSPSICIGKI
jgi:cytohesin